MGEEGDWQRAVRTGAVLLPVVAILAVAGLVAVGQYDLLIMGSYAVVPLVLAPLLYERSRGRVSGRIQGSLPDIPRRLYYTVCLVSLGVAVFFARMSPRPRLFFVALAVYNVTVLCYLLAYSDTFGTLVLLSASSLVYHLSTTLTNAMFLGSGDATVIWIGLQNSLEGAHIAPTAGYEVFPSFFSIATFLGRLTGLDARFSMFVIGASFFVMALWFTTYLTKQLRFVPDRYSALPAVLLTFTYEYYYVGVYSIPRSVFAELAIVPLAIVVSSVLGTRALDRRRKLVLLVVLAGLFWYHKIGHVWFVAIVLGFAVAARTGRLLAERNLPEGLRWSSGSGRLGESRVLLVVGSFAVLYVFVFTNTGLVHRVVYALSKFTGVARSGGQSLIISDPVGLLSTFVGSTVILALFLAGSFSALTSGSNRTRIFALCALVLATTYFPGPIHLSERIMSGLEIYRMTKFVLPIVVVVAAGGYLKLHASANALGRTVLLVLVLTGGVFTLSNDMYARDNPMVETGTFTNFFTESELDSLEFAIHHSDEIVTDVRGYNYVLSSAVVEAGSGERRAQPVFVTGEHQLCNRTVLFNGGELERRGSVLVPYGVSLEAAAELPRFERRSRVYSNGEDIVVIGSRPSAC